MIQPIALGPTTCRAWGDNRLLGPEAPDGDFRWRVTVRLDAGRSAGVLFGMTDDGQQGYVARLDSRLGSLVLARLGPWPSESRLATFRWEPVDGAAPTFRLEVGQGTARIHVEERGAHPLLEARHLLLPGRRLGFYGLDGEARFEPGEPERFEAPVITAHAPEASAFEHIYDPSVGESEPWYVNDHCFIHGDDGWHLFGITGRRPVQPMLERDLAHATACSLRQRPWHKEPPALHFDPARGENHLWAPHVIRRGDTHYMFYCAGSRRSSYDFRIHLATSKDLWRWERSDDNPLFEDFYDARDPMVLLVDGVYYLYYTANLDQEQSHHVVHVRRSVDLLRWSPARVALVHPETGTFGGPTESPFVVAHGRHFYLFCGPDGGYRTTRVYRSPSPLGWSQADPIGSLPAHAAEVVQDLDGEDYVTDCGWDVDGVYLAPLRWVEEPPALSRS